MSDRDTRWIVVGAGFAGAATAWALARAGAGPGIIIEQELSFGMHASGRNAALVKVSESDPIVAALARRTLFAVRDLQACGDRLVNPTGGLSLAGGAQVHELEVTSRSLADNGLATRLISAEQARTEFPFLSRVRFDAALWCPDDGVADIHALLSRYVEEARAGGFQLRTNTQVVDLLIESGRAAGVRTADGGEIRADVVIDAAGAWAGRLGRAANRLPLTPLRRHLFVSSPIAFVRPDLPFVWVEDAGFYFRPEGHGLLLSPCDETAMEPGLPPTDPAAAELLAEKLARHAPELADLAIRRGWACLRTFAPDRRPLVGHDPVIPGLFHVSALGGFGMTCSAAVGELAAGLLTGRPVDWIDTGEIAPGRLFSPGRGSEGA